MITVDHNQTDPIQEVGLSSPFLYPRPTDRIVKQSRILVIDDDEATAKVIKTYLNSCEFSNVEVLSDSHLAIARIVHFRPDLIILDLRMPVRGDRILSQVRSDRRISRTPILALTAETDEATRTRLLNLGANDFLGKPIVANELFARVRNTLSAKVAYDELKEQSEKLKRDVLTDTLTNTANRRAFDFELNRKMLEWNRQQTHFALLMLDVDHFKSINDSFGHSSGDIALSQIAAEINSRVREIDLLCRIGGEEFAVIMPVKNRLESTAAAERIRTAIENSPLSINGEQVPLTVSIGIANTLKGDDTDMIFRRCDAALYASKQRGRNCSTYHDGSACLAVDQIRSGRKPRRVHAPEEPKVLDVTDSKVMIIDDHRSTATWIEAYLKDAGFTKLLVETNSTVAASRIVEEAPDIVLLDLDMPDVSGLEVLEEIRKVESTASTPVVFLTSSTDPELRANALNLGASDFLGKPVVVSELIARVKNSLLAKAHVDLLAGYSAQLERQVEARTSELIASRREAIQCLARAAELRDDITGKHVIRVGRYAAILARELGFAAQELVDLEQAAQLHDVGKIGIPDAVLNKAATLDDDEYELMQNHCRAGSRIISGEKIDGNKSLAQIRNIVDECSSPVMRLAALVAETHHEKWDGSGYPHGLSGKDIPIEGRITAVCDVFDAISTKRPYKEPLPIEECFQIILKGSGNDFDPDVVDAFFRCRDQILEAFEELKG